MDTNIIYRLFTIASKLDKLEMFREAEIVDEYSKMMAENPLARSRGDYPQISLEEAMALRDVARNSVGGSERNHKRINPQLVRLLIDKGLIIDNGYGKLTFTDLGYGVLAKHFSENKLN